MALLGGASAAQAQLALAPPPAKPAAVAVVFDISGAREVRVTRGLADRSTGRAATADSPVRVASVSKLVVALGVMRLVEAGTVDLDTDVSTYLGWRLRHPAHPDVPITLAMLLGHRAGVDDGIDYVLPLDADLAAIMADPKAWSAARRPGRDFTYANLNFPVIAAALEGATGERFDQLMARLVFQPLGLDACFNWTTCSPGAAARAVTLYRANGDVATDGLGGVAPVCPVVRASDGSCDLAAYRLTRHGAAFSPQGGMRISANDLARIGVMMLRRGDGFLKPRSLRRMERMGAVNPASGEGSGGFFCDYGLAIHGNGVRARTGSPCRNDLFGDGVRRIGHSGDAYGLRSGLWIDPRRGTGIAYFVTAVPPDSAGRRSAYAAEEEALVDAARPARRICAKVGPGGRQRASCQ